MNQIDPKLPLSWEFLLNYKKNPLSYTGKLRDVNTEKKHTQFINEKSLFERTNYMIKYLGFLTDNIYTFLDNIFPYENEPGIKQIILFINPIFEKHVTNNFIEKIIKKQTKALGYNEYIYFEQPFERRSLPTITHYHIFMRI